MIGICVCLFGLISEIKAEEFFDLKKEALFMTNIEQLTFPSMGFVKGGEGYFSPDQESIIFQAVPEGEVHYQIYTMSLKERFPKMVSTGKGACTCANFRPDGKKILFASSHEDPLLNDPDREQSVPGYQRNGKTYAWDFTPYMNIYEANLDGTELKALTHGPSYHAECAYSPDGKKIVYASNENGFMNIYTMNVDGSDVRAVTNLNCYCGGPFFSPDGLKIIFRADPKKKDYLQIFMINIDGTNLEQLTDNEAVNWSPYWHPNGKWIAFTTSLHGHRHYEIYLMDMETRLIQRLTHNPSFDGLPVFSPDGSKIMWTSKRGPDQTSQLFLADFTLPNPLSN